MSQPTISRIRKQYVEEGLEAALNRRAPNREYHRKLDGEQEARLVALACSEPPEGQARWSLRLLADRLVELEVVEEISYQTVGRILKKTRPANTAWLALARAWRGMRLGRGGIGVGPAAPRADIPVQHAGRCTVPDPLVGYPLHPSLFLDSPPQPLVVLCL